MQRRLLCYTIHFTLFTVIVPYILYLLAEALEKYVVLGLDVRYLRYFGGLLIFLGIYIMLRAETDMYRHGGGGTPFPFYNPPKRLITEGIYSCCRNPMYLATTLEYCGIGLLLNQLLMIPLSLAVLTCAILFYNLHEKQKLTSMFGETHIQYMSKTPLIIPRPGCLARILTLKTKNNNYQKILKR